MLGITAKVQVEVEVQKTLKRQLFAAAAPVVVVVVVIFIIIFIFMSITIKCLGYLFDTLLERAKSSYQATAKKLPLLPARVVGGGLSGALVL